MNFKLKCLTESYAKEVCEWKYNGICAVYNFPSWEEIKNQKWAITIEKKGMNSLLPLSMKVKSYVDI